MKIQIPQTPGWVVRAAVDELEQAVPDSKNRDLHLVEISERVDGWHVTFSHPKKNSILDRHEREVIVTL